MIKIILDDKTTIECESLSVAKQLLLDACNAERKTDGRAIRRALFLKKIEERCQEYNYQREGGTLSYELRTAINKIIKARLVAEGIIEKNSGTTLASCIERNEELYGAALKMLDKVLPSIERSN